MNKLIGLTLMSFCFCGEVIGQKIDIGVIIKPTIYNYEPRPFNDLKFENEFNFDAGLRLKFHFSDKTSLETGIQYSTKHYVTNYGKGNFPIFVEDIKETVNASYIGLPLNLIYTFLSMNNFSIGGRVGLNPEFLLSADSEYQQLSSIKTDFSNLLWTASLGVSFTKSFENGFSMALTPQFTKYLTEVEKILMDNKPSSIGLELMILKNIK